MHRCSGYHSITGIRGPCARPPGLRMFSYTQWSLAGQWAGGHCSNRRRSLWWS